jgi:hypothetical protein
MISAQVRGTKVIPATAASGPADPELLAGGEPISHPAQRSAVDELILIDGGDGPAVVSRNLLGFALRHLAACQ